MSSTENLDVSVVIPTKNSARTLERCLKSVIKERPSEIIAVDMLSTDETPRILERYGARILLNQFRSVPKSRQLGVEAAKGAFVMFVDSDVELTGACITRLRSDLEKYGWAGIHAMVLSTENVSYWQRSEHEAFSIFFNRVGPKSHIGTGAALFKRQLLIRYPFDPNLIESSEDRDLCLRLRKNGYRVGGSTAVVYHYFPREFRAFVRKRLRYGIGDVRLAFKYRSIRILTAPLESAFSNIVYSLLTKRTRLVPFWLAGGITEFLGVLVGLYKVSHGIEEVDTRLRLLL